MCKITVQTMYLDDIYRKYKILKLNEVVDLELKKLGYKVNYNVLPSNLLAAIKIDSKGNTLEKKHKYNTRQKN